MKVAFKMVLFVLSCVPFVVQARGLRMYNSTNQDVPYRAGGYASGTLRAGDGKQHFGETPLTLSIKKGNLWTPVELYLLKMHNQKKGMPDAKKGLDGQVYELTGELYIEPSGIRTDVGYRNVFGDKLKQ